MRHFADELTRLGYTVRYVKIDAPENTHSFEGEIARMVNEYRPDNLLMTEPSEHRVRELVKALTGKLNCSIVVFPDDRFLVDARLKTGKPRRHVRQV